MALAVIDPELLRQLDTAETNGKAVSAVVSLRATAPLTAQETEERTSSLVERVQQLSGCAPERVKVFRNLGAFAVVGLPPFLRCLLNQEDVATITANVQPETPLIRPVSTSPRDRNGSSQAVVAPARVTIEQADCTPEAMESGRKALRTVRRWFTPSKRIVSDEDGFLDVARSPRLYSPDWLFEFPAALILSPPWLGKTVVAGRIFEALRGNPEAFGFKERCSRTCLGDPGAPSTLLPDWWRAWTADHRGSFACWILDGLDEGEDHHPNILRQILHVIEELSPVHRAHLRLIAFSRDREVVAQFWDSVTSSLSGNVGRSPTTCYLAPLHREAATEFVGRDHFDRIRSSLQNGLLGGLAGYPIILNFLKNHPETERLEPGDVWRGILRELLQEPVETRRSVFKTQLEERFEAVSRLATVLSLTGIDTIRDYSPDRVAVTIANAFQTSPEADRLRAAALEACRSSVFHTLPETRAYRFAHRNIRDWFCAFAMVRLKPAALRSAVADESGKVFPRHREMLGLLHRIHTEPAVKVAIDQMCGITLPSDALPAELSDVLLCLNQLEHLAATTPGGLPWDWELRDRLATLQADDLGEELARRLQDSGRSPEVKELLLDVARLTDTIEAVEAAMGLTIDAMQTAKVRQAALSLVLRLGGQAHLQRLERPIALGEGLSDIDQQLRAQVISQLLESDLWSASKAALYAPSIDEHLLDARFSLRVRISEQMTWTDARSILENRHRILRTESGHASRREVSSLIRTAIDLMCRSHDLPLEDQLFLVDVSVELAANHEGRNYPRIVLQAFRSSAEVRRRFYAYGVEQGHRSDGLFRYVWSFALFPQDWLWLAERAATDWAAHPGIWQDVCQMAFLSTANGNSDSEGWQHAQEFIQLHAPRVWEEFQQRQAAVEQQVPPLEEETDTVVHALNINEWAEQHLREEQLSAVDRMRELAYGCFMPGFDPGVSGNWQDIRPELREQLRRLFLRGFEEGEPTPLPSEDRTFSGFILAEGRAFIDLLKHPNFCQYLTAELIYQWLPTAIFAMPFENEGRADILRLGWEISPGATEKVLHNALDRDLVRESDYAWCTREIPAECWTDSLANHVVELLRNDSGSQEVKRDFLYILTVRCSRHAEPIAREWAERDVPFRNAGINALFVLSPDEGLALAEREFRSRNVEALEQFTSLWGHQTELRILWESWPIVRLQRLVALLLRAYPFPGDGFSELHDGFVTPADQLRELRRHLINYLLASNSVEARTAVDVLGQLDPVVCHWRDQQQTREKARTLFAVQRSPSDPSRLSGAQAVALLEGDEFRIIRSSEDLLNAIVDALQQVEQNVGDDLPMLYGPPQKQPKANGAKKAKNRTIREHLHEDALQAYLRRRLLELLPPRISFPGLVFREDQVKYRRRLDLRVTAPCSGPERVATVVIEVKWSTNPETESSLTEQLGKDYLLTEGLSHGLFLVGWSGSWKRQGQPTSRVSEELKQYLTAQCNQFTSRGAAGQGLHIVPFVLDLQWRDEPESPSNTWTLAN